MSDLTVKPVEPGDRAALAAAVALGPAAHEPELAGRSAFPGRMRLFLGCRDGRPAGRAAGLIHPALRDEAGAPLGQLGYFAIPEEDPPLARALADAACAFLRAEGAREVWGPMNGGSHRAHRLMTRGFERDPFLLEPRNPEHAPRLLEAAGFAPLHAWHSYELAGPGLAALERLLARGVARGGAHGLRTELVPRARALDRLYPLVEATWAGHKGFAPLSRPEFDEAFGPILPIIDDRCIAVATDAGGREVGFSFMYPDLLRPAPRRMVLHSVAVRPDARRTAAPYLLIQAAMPLLRADGIDEVVVALVTERWRTFERIAEATRTYVLYGRAL